MAINALLARLVFDKNPGHEFYIEESFPLDWMNPHLTPAGPIFKLNREPLTAIPDAVVQQDREYWTRLLDPIIGDWLRESTPVQAVAEFAAQAYSKQPVPSRFLGSDSANKWASKLRSSIGGLYFWRATRATDPAEKKRMTQESDFAFRQAYAVCPYSPEALFRYVNLLMAEGRSTDALRIARASETLQPDDTKKSLVSELERIKATTP
jgi:hypothetical protein